MADFLYFMLGAILAGIWTSLYYIHKQLIIANKHLRDLETVTEVNMENVRTLRRFKEKGLIK